MDSKRVISLLLAGQMLSAPMAQATSLSLLDKAQRERQGRGSIVSTNAPSPGGRLVIPSAARCSRHPCRQHVAHGLTFAADDSADYGYPTSLRLRGGGDDSYPHSRL